jgi:hypothetical protein
MLMFSARNDEGKWYKSQSTVSALEMGPSRPWQQRKTDRAHATAPIRCISQNAVRSLSVNCAFSVVWLKWEQLL